MPSYRDRRGRFTTRSIWEALFPPETPSETPRSSGGIPNWNENPVPWGELWSSQTWDEATSKWIGDLVPLDLDALADAEYLGGEYRVVFSVPDNPDYPRGFAMSDRIYGEWPPSVEMGESIGATGIVAVHFVY